MDKHEQATILERLTNLILTNASEHAEILLQVKKINNTVANHDQKIVNLEKEDIKMKSIMKVSKITWLIIGLLISVLLFLIEKVLK